jgi:glycosyltransferase involved in cell wall biosynthesis
MNINVLMPVYATPLAWLRLAVDSIIYQNHPNFNLIIVDDNNPVGEITDFFDHLRDKFPMIKVVRKDSNSGIASALNFGLQHCHGDLIVRMDGDDIANPDLLKSHDEFFTQNPDKHICGVQIHLFDSEHHWYSSHPCKINRALAYLKPGHWFVNHPGIAFRRSAISSVGGYDPTPATLPEDYALWIKFLLAGYTIYNSESVLIDYRVHLKSFSFAPNRESADWHNFLKQQKALLYERGN